MSKTSLACARSGEEAQWVNRSSWRVHLYSESSQPAVGLRSRLIEREGPTGLIVRREVCPFSCILLAAAEPPVERAPWVALQGVDHPIRSQCVHPFRA